MTHLGDLNQDLQQRLEADRKEIEQIYREESEKLKQNLAKESQSVLNFIKADTKRLKGQINLLLKLCLVLPGATAMSILIASLIGSWGLTRSLTNQAQQIQEQKKTLEALKKQTWGIELYQTENGRFIILPPDSREKTNWKCQGKPCIKI